MSGENVDMYVLSTADKRREARVKGSSRIYQAALPRRAPRSVQQKASTLEDDPEAFLDPVLAYEAGSEGYKINGTRMRKVTGLKHFRRSVLRWSFLGLETLDVPDEYFDALCIVACSFDRKEKVVAIWC